MVEGEREKEKHFADLDFRVLAFNKAWGHFVLGMASIKELFFA